MGYAHTLKLSCRHVGQLGCCGLCDPAGFRGEQAGVLQVVLADLQLDGHLGVHRSLLRLVDGWRLRRGAARGEREEPGHEGCEGDAGSHGVAPGSR